jgi:putative Mg2+ transporter-C (MgtC) family protein
MAQGIMTGIGFLGAGVIFKEGVTVRGLTTAASIWITAALGILYGVGFYYPAVLGTVATLGVLAAFRWLERLIPSQFFAELSISFAREQAPSEAELRQILKERGFNIAAMAYQLDDAGRAFEYRTVIRTLGASNAEKLAAHLLGRDDVIAFSMVPTVN